MYCWLRRWIVGLVIAADTVRGSDIDKVMSVTLIISFASASIISGSMVSGILLDAVLDSAEYWLIPGGILVVDIIARLLLIDNLQHLSTASTDNSDETTTLLPSETEIEPHDAPDILGFLIFPAS